MWFTSLTKLLKQFNLYVSAHCDKIVTPNGTFIHELCLIRDVHREHVITSNEITMLIEYLCTI